MANRKLTGREGAIAVTATEHAQEKGYDTVFEQIAGLVEEFEAHPDEDVQEKVSRLLNTIDAIHRMCFNRLISVVESNGGGQILALACSDPVVHTLFDAYQLLPVATPEGGDGAVAAVTRGIPGMDPSLEEDLTQFTWQTDYLVQELDGHLDEEYLDKLATLLQAIDLFHRTGLHRLVALIESNGGGHILGLVRNDALVRTLLDFYDLLAKDTLQQVEQALAGVRPSINAEGGDVKVLDVKDGVVNLRLTGPCWAKGPTATALKREIMHALRSGFAEFKSIEVEQGKQPNYRGEAIAESALDSKLLKEQTWHSAMRLEDLPSGEVTAGLVAGVYVLLARLGDQVYAYRDACGSRSLRVSFGKLHGEVLHCPWHGCLFDLRTGKEVKDPEVQLEGFPVKVDHGEIMVALP